MYSPLLINEVFLLSSPVDVGHIDRITLNTGVMSSLFLLAYIAICLSLYLSSLALEAHCYNKLVSELVLFLVGFEMASAKYKVEKFDGRNNFSL